MEDQPNSAERELSFLHAPSRGEHAASNVSSSSALEALTAGPAGVLLGSANHPSTTHAAIRPRTRPGLPSLALPMSGTYQYQANDVLFDKLEYKLTAPIAFEHPEDLDEFVDMLGNPMLHEHPLFAVQQSPRLSENGRGRIILSINKGWHLTGRVELRMSSFFSGIFAVDLSLNPTRWIGALTDNTGALSQPAELALRKGPAVGSCETLDGNDNLLPMRNRLGRPQAAWQVSQFVDLTAVYLSKVEELFEAFLRPRVGYPLPIAGLSSLKLPPASYVEAYLEWYSDDAPSDLGRIKGAALAAMDAVNAVTFKRVGYASQGNSSSVTVWPTKKVQVTAYSKSANTVRTEVRYSGDINDSAFRNDRARSRTAVEQLIGIRSDAVRRLQRFIDVIAQHCAQARSTTSGINLVTQVHEACRACPSYFDVLLSLLVTTGGASVAASTPLPFNAAVANLVRAGVLYGPGYQHGNASVSKRYSLTPNFRDAALRLA